jgi:hypothetical protein
MSITYNWAIANLEREVSDGYVFTAHWTVVGISDDVDPEGNPYNSGAYGSMGLERPEGNLIPFDELTQEQVVGWVKDKFGPDKVTEIEKALAARIVDQQFPTVEAGVPWQ